MAQHGELISANAFLDKFKNTLRNYYIYGFRNFDDIQGSKSTLNDDWVRLTNILNDCFEWSAKNKKVCILTSDSQTMTENPFHRLYKFCRYNKSDVIYFFNIMLAMSSEYIANEEIYSVGISEKIAMNIINEKEYEKLKNTIRCDKDEFLRLEESLERKIFTAKQLAAFCPDTGKFLSGEKRTVSNLADRLCNMGLLTKVSKKRPNQWQISKITLKNLLDVGRSTDKMFDRHFQDVIDFFSRSKALGEFGNFLISRFPEKNKSPFRFKHDYYFQSLNDFCIVDLLNAIENNKWCRISHKNAMSEIKKEIICFPLQIRVSAKTGRQYLAFYEPFEHKYGTMRIENIDSINYVYDISNKYGMISCDSPQILSELEHSMMYLDFAWGVSASDLDCTRDVPLNEVKLRIIFDNEKENYILRKFKKEKRKGKISVGNGYIDYSVFVSDTVELRPWIRSFYSRIISCTGMDNKSFSIETDIRNMKAAFDGHKIKDNSIVHSIGVKWQLPDDVDMKTEECHEHDFIFNEIFSVYYHIWADVLGGLCAYASGDTLVTSDRYKDIFRNAIKENNQYSGTRTSYYLVSDNSSEYNINNALKNNGFIYRENDEDDVHIKYRASGISSPIYFNTIPLTFYEIRWLLTILSFPEINFFLDKKTIYALSEYLSKSNIKPFATDKIFCFDRCFSVPFCTENLNKTFKIILDSVHTGREINIKYKSASGNIYNGIYCPAFIEYSKYTNRFKIFALFKETGKMYILKIDRILEINITENIFPKNKLEEAVKNFISSNQKYVTVTFTNEKNMPDRVLTEFAPWKKVCEYDKLTGTYKLTIYYNRFDENDVMIRLMSYGTQISFANKEHSIYKEIKERIKTQYELIRSSEKEKILY